MVVASAVPLTVFAASVPIGVAAGHGAGHPAVHVVAAVMFFSLAERTLRRGTCASPRRGASSTGRRASTRRPQTSAGEGELSGEGGASLRGRRTQIALGQ